MNSYRGIVRTMEVSIAGVEARAFSKSRRNDYSSPSLSPSVLTEGYLLVGPDGECQGSRSR